MDDYKIKLERIYRLLERESYAALVFGRRDNFAWLTGGKESGVVLNQEKGFVYLVVMRDRKIAVSMHADARKAQEELLAGMGFEMIVLDWKSSGIEAYIEELLRGRRFLSDCILSGASYDQDEMNELQYPMTECEVSRYKELGRLTDMILKETAAKIKEGMTENALKAEFLKLCAEYDVQADVLLLGSDDRIKKYRHCTPTDKRIKKTILISPVLRKYGLHSNVARMACIGEVPEEMRSRYDTVCRIQAEIIAACREGMLFKEIFELQEKLYRDAGYKDEWLLHRHGAPVGYMLSDGEVLYSKTRRIKKNQAYEWYITIAGAKSAELAMNVEGKQEVLSLAGEWPEKEYTAVSGIKISLPDILSIQP